MLRFVFAALLLLAPSVAVADITGKPRVIDGDTIEIAGERIRLHGIDAPESKQTCTDIDGKAKARLDKWINEDREENGVENIPAWRIHDLRRTVASGLARLKVPQIVVEKVQNRVTGEGAGVAGVYNRYSYMEEREAALTAWARHIESLIKSDVESGDVIEFQAHKG